MRTFVLPAFLVLCSVPSFGQNADPAVLKAHVTTKPPTVAVAELQGWGDKLGGYNPVCDLLDPKLRPTLEAVVQWRPAFAKAGGTTPPTSAPVVLAAARDDLDLVQLLVKAGALVETEEPVAAGAQNLPAIRTPYSTAKSEKVRSWLKANGAKEALSLAGNAVSREFRVRIRSAPVTGDLVGYLTKGEKVAYAQVTTLWTTMDGREAPWYEVSTAAGLKGWVWGGLLVPGARTK